MALEITAEGWVAIIGAATTGLVAVVGAVTAAILAWRSNQKLDAAANRREEIKEELKS